VVGKIRDLILQLSKSSIYSTKPRSAPTRQYIITVPDNSLSYNCILVSKLSLRSVHRKNVKALM
ncbi:phage tail assembly protein, partial [Klebsiella pneumoniae]|nr:phage tail assembly protein [Klebsiella pneumoniae]